MCQGRQVLEAAPVFDQTSAFWRYCKRIAAPLIEDGLVHKNETDRTMEFGKGRIRSKTAWDADSLRGDYADLLILDEFSQMKPDAWNEVGAPMLLDNDGDAVFIGTPKRKNHFHSLYVRAVGDDTGRWRAWHGSSLDNPYLSKAALADITADMTEDAYKQEILAEFLDNEGAVFRNLAACISAPPTTPDAHAGHELVAGLDWAKQNDFTAISILCKPCAREVARDRFNKIDYHFQRDRLRALYDRWHVTRIIGEANSIGGPNIEELQRDGLRVQPFETTGTSKPPLIESLSLAFERAEIQWQSDPIWTAELEAYEMRVSPTTGRTSYSAPDGVHDDTVIARALALYGVQRRGMFIG